MSSGMEKFVEDSILDILIPEASQLDIEDALSSTDTADESALIPTIPQRNVLFFGTTLVNATLGTISYSFLGNTQMN